MTAMPDRPNLLMGAPIYVSDDSYLADAESAVQYNHVNHYLHVCSKAKPTSLDTLFPIHAHELHKFGFQQFLDAFIANPTSFDYTIIMTEKGNIHRVTWKNVSSKLTVAIDFSEQYSFAPILLKTTIDSSEFKTHAMIVWNAYRKIEEGVYFPTEIRRVSKNTRESAATFHCITLEQLDTNKPLPTEFLGLSVKGNTIVMDCDPQPRA
ncbi:MAG: hypothetical protein ACRCZF_21500, partial [Gemmataceae bacterium]